MSKKETRANKPVPQCLAMILCDQIIVEQGTNKHVLIGTFSQISVAKLPAVHPAMWVFIALTEGRGEYNGLLKLLHAETNQVLFEAAGPLGFENPLQVLEIRMLIPPIRFEEPGVHCLDLYVDGAQVMSRRFSLEVQRRHGQ